MTIPDTAKIDALWFEPGTAADAAAAVNLHRPEGAKISGNWIRSRWKLAQDRGRLPPINRPPAGFNRLVSFALKRVFMVMSTQGKAA